MAAVRPCPRGGPLRRLDCAGTDPSWWGWGGGGMTNENGACDEVMRNACGTSRLRGDRPKGVEGGEMRWRWWVRRSPCCCPLVVTTGKQRQQGLPPPLYNYIFPIERQVIWQTRKASCRKHGSKTTAPRPAAANQGLGMRDRHRFRQLQMPPTISGRRTSPLSKPRAPCQRRSARRLEEDRRP